MGTWAKAQKGTQALGVVRAHGVDAGAWAVEAGHLGLAGEGPGTRG